MEILTTEKEITRRFKNLTYKDIKNGNINITIYASKTGGTIYGKVNANFTLTSEDTDKTYSGSNYIYVDYIVKVGGYGYDRHSTALSNGLNLFKNIYKKKTTLKYKADYCSLKEYYTKDNKRVYGLSKDNSISYGIGTSAVLYAVKEGFSNLKLTSQYYGLNEDSFKFEIKGVK